MKLSHFLKNNFRIIKLKGITYALATFCMLVLMTEISHAQLTSDNGWILLRNQSLYGNNTDGIYFKSNKSTVTQLVMRDKEGTNYGRLYGNSDGEQFGLMDGDGSWSYLANKDSWTAFKIDNSEKMRIEVGGDIGMGTTNPQENLHLAFQGRGGIRMDSDNTGDVFLQIRNGSSIHYIFDDRSDGNALDIESYNDLVFNTSGSNERMRILSTGEVSIGTTAVPTGYLLSVDGKVIAEEMRVKPSNFWDEVFETDYDLMSIEEKQQFTESNKHLPSFAPEAEIVDKGMDVGKSFADVAKELEEAYLYIYQLNDKMKALEAQVKKLSEQSND